MGFSVYAHAWRAGIVACGLAWLGSAELRAETPEPSAPIELIQPSTEPFGLVTSSLTSGGLHDKWLGVQRRLDDEMVQLALCEGDREGCVLPAALKFLDIVENARLRDGRARLGEINRAINLSIKATSDLAQHRQIDVWSSPLATLERGGGDCEDYAIAKFVALRRAGIAPDDLRIVIMHDIIRGEDHAVAAARLEGRWLMLDNRRMAMVWDANVRNYRPTFVIGQHGVMRYADSPLLAGALDFKPAASLATSSLTASADLSFDSAD
ncbi:transglutaminase-like cysteine peptidase [Bradyrhizobium sp. WSM 1738]|uniref:transglutaminase-like cysteine peptidase n=1 Tax=Bradyrhizobium hereditatis TaxID=2821405 RepID=UPI001CE3512E|nr:transglutaminase-like cysteine peptidase [Bradyrhizobium hereditatis]MCA6115415.1 transglutaminase-like cysteine peptidase [Bradyrhizobium hereditatis]